MTPLGVGLCLLALILVWLWRGMRDGLGFFGNCTFMELIAAVAWFAYQETRPEALAEEARETAKRAEECRQEQVPRFYADAPDGCKVYMFKPDNRWLYFTRCPSSKTVTENEWRESCGKNCSKTVTSPIETTTN